MKVDCHWTTRDRKGLGASAGRNETSWSVVGVADEVDVRLVDEQGRTLWLSMSRVEAARLAVRLVSVSEPEAHP